MAKQAVFIFGTPGSGKGTQANLLAWTKGFYHWDSGKQIRQVLYDPANQNNARIKKEREMNEKGILNSPVWVLSMFKKEAKKIAKAGMSIVYSGSPRTMYEAFGNKTTKGLVETLEKLYGKENVHAFYLDIKPEIAAGRNQIRRTCTVCATMILSEAPVTECPICMGELSVRKDDNPETYKTRYEQYTTRTLPILDELRKRGMNIVTINADQKPPVIFKEILQHLQ
jgi:adenylate kinase